ncbi:F-box/LRR-repeat protein 25-like [Fagus crenata]
MEPPPLKVDRISDLPEIVLQRILSFLPTKQVVQSTLLSTTWKQVWSTFPILKFDEYLEKKFWLSEEENISDSQRKRKKEELYNFVEKTLLSHQRQKLRINNFTLRDCLVEQESVSRVDRWFSFVIESNVQELNLGFVSCIIPCLRVFWLQMQNP